MSNTFIVLCLLVNIFGIFAFPKSDWKEEYHSPKGRHWEYETKIKHPAPHYHKGGDKGYVHSYDSGPKHSKHYNHFEPEVKHELYEEVPIKLPPIHIPKYDTGLEHKYEPKKDYIHYEPKHVYYEPKKEYIHYETPKNSYHYEPKKEEPKKEKDFVPDLNIDGIIDDIQKDLKKTGYIAKA